jgi:hypothetical protein
VSLAFLGAMGVVLEEIVRAIRLIRRVRGKD